jgi:hypothetical protein
VEVEVVAAVDLIAIVAAEAAAVAVDTIVINLYSKIKNFKVWLNAGLFLLLVAKE